MMTTALPTADFQIDLVPGAIKQFKTQHRRSDAMSFVAPEELEVIPGFNVRIRDASYEAHVRALADSMKADGFKVDKPISVFVAAGDDGRDRCFITDGHSRFEALQIANAEGAGIDQVPVVILPKAASMEDLTIDLVRSNSGRPLSMYETAIVVKRLLNADYSEDEIAEKLSFTTTHVRNLATLAAAPKAIVNLIVAGKLSASTAVEAIRKHGPVEAARLLKDAASRAEADGKPKISAAHLPGARFAKTLKKTAPRLYEAARQVREDPAYDHLRAETRQALDELLAQLADEAPASSENAA